MIFPETLTLSSTISQGAANFRKYCHLPPTFDRARIIPNLCRLHPYPNKVKSQKYPHFDIAHLLPVPFSFSPVHQFLFGYARAINICWLWLLAYTFLQFFLFGLEFELMMARLVHEWFYNTLEPFQGDLCGGGH